MKQNFYSKMIERTYNHYKKLLDDPTTNRTSIGLRMIELELMDDHFRNGGSLRTFNKV
jgi:hypothetical protein